MNKSGRIRKKMNGKVHGSSWIAHLSNTGLTKLYDEVQDEMDKRGLGEEDDEDDEDDE